MTGLYLFAAVVGVPLAAWSALSGGDDAGDGGDVGGEGVLGDVLRAVPLSTVAFVLAAFGACGLLLGITGAGALTTFVAAALVGVLAGVANSTLFAYLRRTDSTSDVSDRQLAGAVGRVILPVGTAQRGRVALEVGGQRIQLSAQAMPDSPSELEVGASVLVVEVERGIARVTRLDPELD